MSEDLSDHRRIFDGGDDFQGAIALGVGFSRVGYRTIFK